MGKLRLREGHNIWREDGAETEATPWTQDAPRLREGETPQFRSWGGLCLSQTRDSLGTWSELRFLASLGLPCLQGTEGRIRGENRVAEE